MHIDISLIFAAITLVLGLIFGWFYHKRWNNKQISGANLSAKGIIEDATREITSMRKEAEIEAKELSHRYRNEIDVELADRKKEIKDQEKILVQRERTLNHKDEVLEKREQSLLNKQDDLSNREEIILENEIKAKELVKEQAAKLEEVAGLSKQDARTLILNTLTEDLESKKADLIRQSENEVRLTADKRAKQLITEAIERSAADTVSETTVSFVELPDDAMKGRIIGKEGRNIKSFETLTGVDLIIDDTPDIVTISSFDPIRREIAKIALEKLVADGRIHPARIESAVEKARKEIDEKIRDYGEDVVFDLGIRKIHPDIVKVLGRLKYRTSYGQNVLQHSIEVAKLTGLMANEIGEDENMARLAGLLHDIGKALDTDTTGSHVDLGVALAEKYHEPAEVIDAIATHHGDAEPKFLISSLVAAADAISAARPGARSESLEQYIKRLHDLEDLANDFKGVDHTFAIQAGREIRVVVKPDKISDSRSTVLAHEIKNKIEKDLDYPGYIKVTVIRETRRVEVAK